MPQWIPGKKGPPELVSHNGYLAGRGRGGSTGGDDLALGQGTGDGDGVGDAGSTVRRRRRRGDARGVGGATVDGVVEAVLLVELGRGDGVVGLHRDLAAGAVVDGVDGTVVADSKGDVEGLDPEDEVAGDVTFEGLQRQVALLSSLCVCHMREIRRRGNKGIDNNCMPLHNAQKGGVKKEKKERKTTLVRREGYNRWSWSRSKQGLVRLFGR